MGFLVFCDTDEEGNITLYVAGPRIIPDKQYEHFFYLMEPVDPSDYKVVDGQLIKKEI